MAHAKNHDYHILHPSVWPFLGAIAAFLMLYGAVGWMHSGEVHLWLLPVSGPWLFLMGLVGVLYVMYSWWADVIHEGEMGDHTPVVRIGLQYGFILFITSEVMFFVAWFWAFFKNAMYPMGPESPIKDGVWPPEGIATFDPWHLPLINTLVLLLSGVAVTWAHHALVHENDRKTVIRGLIVAIVLGAFFTVLQAYEYSHAAFGLSDTVYGGVFFMATGFHGAHVIIGTIFLAVCLFRFLRGQMSQEQHVGFEAAAWYWHFVDVVWLFLFFSIYIWGR
ncbi:cytochrome c oxidase subunit 3 (plasmid) [Paracoccus sp. TK19116]|uniref:cytochrome-c oxidase n=1 Tax=Paracoccus albicereus TaxID=2922394 RepID=A0ABT1MKV8_9RHOB|nr:cytochrome c oxidase subunit 3 [Paracoccus albicereus]MCQ0968938.1 cytochrome c oxidase subunit 3 [Paracoccus albicereus]